MEYKERISCIPNLTMDELLRTAVVIFPSNIVYAHILTRNLIMA